MAGSHSVEWARYRNCSPTLGCAVIELTYNVVLSRLGLAQAGAQTKARLAKTGWKRRGVFCMHFHMGYVFVDLLFAVWGSVYFGTMCSKGDDEHTFPSREGSLSNTSLASTSCRAQNQDLFALTVITFGFDNHASD